MPCRDTHKGFIKSGHKVQSQQNGKNMIQRLFTRNDLARNAAIACTDAQNNYLRNVLRLGAGAEILLFNGRDGEWRARIERITRKICVLVVTGQTRTQEPPGDLHYLFAPLKKARLDYMAQKAVEMGASRLRPVLTRFTTTRRVKLERMEANAVEAAEQCNLLSIPEIDAPGRFEDIIDAWPQERVLVFCDETAPAANPAGALANLRGRPLAVIIGPEGGFSEPERGRLRAAPFVTPISLGPRILRADTAAVAALALVQAMAGDWSSHHDNSF